MGSANWTDIIQTVAVVAALLFAAWEFRARAREQRFRNYLDAISGFVGLASLMVEKPELHRLYEYTADESAKTYAELSADERARVHYCDTIIALCETVWVAAQEGWLSKDEWEYWKRWAHDLNGSREFRWTLKWVADEYDRGFVAAMWARNQPVQ